jgi:hypothetical protein
MQPYAAPQDDARKHSLSPIDRRSPGLGLHMAATRHAARFGRPTGGHPRVPRDRLHAIRGGVGVADRTEARGSVAPSGRTPAARSWCRPRGQRGALRGQAKPPFAKYVPKVGVCRKHGQVTPRLRCPMVRRRSAGSCDLPSLGLRVHAVCGTDGQQRIHRTWRGPHDDRTCCASIRFRLEDRLRSGAGIHRHSTQARKC